MLITESPQRTTPLSDIRLVQTRSSSARIRWVTLSWLDDYSRRQALLAPLALGGLS